jgi:UDP-glucose 4-epimerase
VSASIVSPVNDRTGADSPDPSRRSDRSRSLVALRERPAGLFTAYDVFSAVPYEEADAAALRSDPMSVIARHWPDAPELMQKAGVEVWGPINEWYDISKAERELGWRPRWGFTEYLAALREGRDSL